MLGINSRFARWVTRALTRPLKSYHRTVHNNIDSLHHFVQKGDVVLIEGDARISQAIKYLTQSCWSHTAMYIGDELIRMGGVCADWARTECGEDADHAVIEALVEEGVTVSPLSKYANYNIRLCRPFGLSKEDRQTVIAEAISQLGFKYDIRNVIDLARYLIPFSLIPRRYRETALHFGSGVPTEVICSSLIAKSFQKVGFPILPVIESPKEQGRRPGRFTPIEKTLLGTPSDSYTGVLRMRHPTLLTPRDFDLSPYYSVVKFNIIEEGVFDYKKIRWAHRHAA